MFEEIFLEAYNVLASLITQNCATPRRGPLAYTTEVKNREFGNALGRLKLKNASS